MLFNPIALVFLNIPLGGYWPTHSVLNSFHTNNNSFRCSPKKESTYQFTSVRREDRRQDKKTQAFTSRDENFGNTNIPRERSVYCTVYERNYSSEVTDAGNNVVLRSECKAIINMLMSL